MTAEVKAEVRANEFMEEVRKKLAEFGLPRIIIIILFLSLFVVAYFAGMNVPSFAGDVLRRWGMWGILVLAMVPSIQAGIGPNFGITVGIVPGLLGAVVSMDLRHRGFFDGITNEALFAVAGAVTAIVAGVAMAIVIGILYGLLNNRVKGSEMAVSVYVGFSAVALFNIVWARLPVVNPILILPGTGRGLRQVVNLRDDFGRAFDGLLRFEIPFPRGTMVVHTGLLIVFFLLCFLMYLFLKSRTGMMMSSAGANPEYARATGINVDRMRILGTTMSTALGAFGIVVYAQSFGFLQLYSAPLMMGFISVASILIGGATVKRASVVDVLLGAFLLNGILVIALPLTTNFIPDMPGIPEILRIIATYGIILYALSRVKGGGR